MLEKFINDPKADVDNQESKVIAKFNNTIKVVAPGADPDAADKQGRGLTTASINFDSKESLYKVIYIENSLICWKPRNM